MSNIPTNILLSEKYIDFIYSPFKIEVLEGVTSAGKTTVGAVVKLIIKVMQSNRSQHILAGRNVGVVVKNIIESDMGILKIWGDIVEFFPNGHGSQKMPHLIIHCQSGVNKIIFIVNYNNTSSWKTLLGGQYGCVFVDECNIADITFINEISARFSDWECFSLNPDSPDNLVYEQYINHCRPLKKYKKDVPKEILTDLYSVEAKKGWCYWFFNFEDNEYLRQNPARIEQIKESVPIGTKMYKNKILGLREKASGLIYSNFDKKRHIIDKIYLQNEVKNGRVKFVKFSCGLDTSYSQKSKDTVAFSFIGITQKSEVILLDELVLRNNENNPFAPSDIVLKAIDFLEKNRKEWGMSKAIFIDAADAATLQEALKYKREKGSIYQFEASYKKTKIIDRINLILGWLDTGHYLVCNNCKEHIKECEKYSWDEKKDGEAEDKNNHTIDSMWYALAPFRTYIGTKAF